MDEDLYSPLRLIAEVTRLIGQEPQRIAHGLLAAKLACSPRMRFRACSVKYSVRVMYLFQPSPSIE